MINLIHIEFDYPPSKLIIYTGEFITHMMPYKVIDYTQLILKASGKYSLMKSNDVFVNINNPIKFITLRFLNEMNIPISVQLLKVRIFINNSSLLFPKVRLLDT
jgi:hypothetical protein